MVTELVKSKNNYQSAFRSLQQDSPAVSWVGLLRESAMDQFELLGFPSVSEEEWRYTNLAPIVKADFQPVLNDRVSEIGRTGVPLFSYPETSRTQIVLVNGFLRKDLSATSELGEVVVLDLSSAVADERYERIVRTYLARNANYDDNGLIALNTAFIQSGIFVLIPKDVKLEAPLLITYLSEPGSSNNASFPRVLVVAEENSSAILVESYRSVSEAVYFTNAVMEIVLKEGARLEHYRLQRESTRAFHVSTTAAKLGPKSSYDTTSITLGAQLSRHDIEVVMDHEGAECWVDGLYVVGSDQHADTHSVIDHIQSHCTSHQLYKGILDGKSRAVFNGKIFVRPGAQKTDAMQTNKNLLLSNEARVDTKPQLEILADDVKCAHGAAVGQIDQDELFYLETRGLNPELARNLLTYGFAEEVIAKIKIDSLRTQIDELVLHHLKARLEV
jgi:Fe-S cluster assembly protein SufD